MDVALAQLRIEPGSPDVNRSRALRAVADGAARGADLIILPELFTVGYFAFDRYSDTAAGLTDEPLTSLRDAARSHNVGIVAGSIVENLADSREAGFETPAPEGYANTSALIDRTGEIRSVYRKHHLFGYDSAERDLLTPGESLQTAEFEGFTIGTTTCYDLRFPALYRELLDRGVTLVVVPSAWPYPRVEHWQTLPKARAIENLCFVAAVNGVAEFKAAQLCGRSALYDPWGTRRVALGEQDGLSMARITPGEVQSRREEFPALADRRDL